MGILNISDELDDQFEDTKLGEGGSRLGSGTYEGTITDVKLVTGDDVWKPWIDVALSVKFNTDEGSISQQYEVMPLTGKDGNVSPGKLKFIKWQLSALGYEGKLKDLEDAILQGTFHGNRVKFEVKETVSTSINQKTGKPYVNTEVVAKDFLEAGLGGGDVSGFATAFDAVVV